VLLKRVLVQILGRHVYDDDFVRGLDERLRDGAPGAAAGDALDGVLLFGDVLEIDGGDDVDPARAESLHFFPAVCVAAAGRVVAGEFVNKADLRCACAHGVDIDHFAIAFDDGRDDFKLGEQVSDFVFAARLDDANNDILTALFAATAFIEHAQGFANTRSVAEEDLEASAGIAGFLRSDAAEEFLGIRAFGRGRHLFL
jgi:hypothetical protein